MSGHVYILANMRRGRTYVGVTNDLVRSLLRQVSAMTCNGLNDRNAVAPHLTPGSDAHTPARWQALPA